MNIHFPTSPQSKMLNLNQTLKTAEKETKYRHPIETEQKPLNGSSHVWETLARKYNVRNMTFKDIVAIANSLYEANEISLKEVATMTFDYEKATEYIRQAVSVSPNYNLFETNANMDGSRDWIKEFEARANKNFRLGNLLGFDSNMKIVSILKKIERY